MKYRWLVRLLTMTIVSVVLPFALPARTSAAGSADLQEEHEQTVRIGVTSCGVERWSIKVRRVGAWYDCLGEARSSRGR